MKPRHALLLWAVILLEPGLSGTPPKGWRAKPEKNGYAFFGPSAGGAGALIALRCYAPGDRLYPSADAFLERRRSTAVPVAGERLSPVRRLRVAGRPARAFTRESPQTAPNTMSAKSLRVTEETVVVERAKGFCGLTLRAASSAFPERKRDFDGFLRSLSFR